jgi:hypothetical protein
MTRRPGLPGRRFVVSVALAAVALLSGCTERPPAPSVESFLARHWADPLPPQGTPPQAFSPLEASLSPRACGQCHVEQYEAWRESLHSRTVGPGLLWQLKLMDQAQANRCLRCHAPLAEQKALLALEHGWEGAPPVPPPGYVGVDLAHDGLVCAACHVRGHQRFGPPARAGGSGAKSAPEVASARRGDGSVAGAGGLPHGGFTVSEAFQDSRFCAHCHQFPEDGPRLAGKLFEDTWEQWAASPMAGEHTCQSCHMPDRKHRWRGIHDPETTRSAVDIALRIEPLGDGRWAARTRVRNVGAGHHFPTYMVAKVELSLVRRDADGSAHALGQHVIGWMTDTQITREIFDTRIPAGEARDFDDRFDAPHADWHLELVVRVKPGEHYERMYREHLARRDELPPAAVPHLQRALQQVVSAEYELTRLTVRPAIAN